ncbi:MAG TPA: HAMP domain-containing sensor histidine kinase [Actinomycetota bacterium]|nr:HAMP domain-containing sensor histidine kinase [Actinomycetota bacterium]
MAAGDRLTASSDRVAELEEALAERDAKIARLEELDGQKNDFVATVSHELRTPITAMIGAAKTLRRGGDQMSPEERETFLQMIERQGDRLLRLTRGVLAGAQVEAGGAPPRRERTDLATLARDVAAELLDAFGHSHEIEVTTDPEEPAAWGDPSALRQIMSNLVENALKYSPKGSKVRVGVFDLSSQTLIEVSDDGPGIDAAEIGTIFERFKQIESSRSGGFGLGLYIVKTLVEQHRGTIEVASEPGAGTTFRVRLPKRSAQRER